MKAENMAERMAKLHKDVANQLEKMNEGYKKQASKHRRFKEFKEKDLVMVYLRKARFSAGKYNKLQPKKIGPYRIVKKFGDDAYKIELPSHININPIFKIVDIFEYSPLGQIST
ncbi:Asp_protease_2 domain-containing protein [Cucumis melo var. makuwa]|nr:Asp_protease_2 domain-containing protein [Cucumis melo var. makuwa]